MFLKQPQLIHFQNAMHLNHIYLQHKNNEIKIPKEIVKKYINKLIESCLDEKNNYSLFKYLYLNPGGVLDMKIYIKK